MGVSGCYWNNVNLTRPLLDSFTAVKRVPLKLANIFPLFFALNTVSFIHVSTHQWEPTRWSSYQWNLHNETVKYIFKSSPISVRSQQRYTHGMYKVALWLDQSYLKYENCYEIRHSIEMFSLGQIVLNINAWYNFWFLFNTTSHNLIKLKISSHGVYRINKLQSNHRGLAQCWVHTTFFNAITVVHVTTVHSHRWHNLEFHR